MKLAIALLAVLGACAHEGGLLATDLLKKAVSNSSDPVQTPCGKGTWRKEIGAPCVNCPIGFFQNLVGGEDDQEFVDLRSQCKTCRMGTFTDEEGQEECKQCPSGFTNTGLDTDNKYMLFNGKVGKQDFVWVDLKVPSHQRLNGFDSEEEVTNMRKAKGEETDLDAVKARCAANGKCKSFCFNKDEITVYYNVPGTQGIVDAGSAGWSCFKRDGQKEADQVVIDGTFNSILECEYECSKDEDCMAFDYDRLLLQCTKRSGVCFDGTETPFRGDEDSCIFHCPAGQYWDGSKCNKETPGLVYCGCKRYYDSDSNTCKMCPDHKFTFDQHHQMDESFCQASPEEDCPTICPSGKHWDTVLGCIDDVEGEEYCNCRQYAVEDHGSHAWNYSTPAAWKISYPKCGGSAQSPINIVTDDAKDYYRKELSVAWQSVEEEDELTKVMKGTLDTDTGSDGDGMDDKGNDDARAACLASDTCVGYCASTIGGGKARYYKSVNANKKMEYVDESDTTTQYECYTKMNSIQSVWDDEMFKVSDPLGGRKIAQNGYNEQVDGNFGSFYDYKVKSFNFHSPSEHKIDGTAYDMEMHIVMEQDADHQVIFAILFSKNSTTDTNNTWLESIQFMNAPNTSGPADGRKPVSISENIEPFSAFSKILDSGYFQYPGSLTTPPCSETVSWFVFDTPAVVGEKQIEYFKSIYPDPANARPVQDMNGREVQYGSFKTPPHLKTGEESVFMQLRETGPALIEEYKSVTSNKDIHHRKCMPCPYDGDKPTWVGDNRHDAKRYMCVAEPEVKVGKPVVTTGWRSCFAAGTDRCQNSCEGYIKSQTCDPNGEVDIEIECMEEIETDVAGYCVCDKTKKVGAYGCEPKPYKNCNEACDTDRFATWRQSKDDKWDGERDIFNDKSGETEIDSSFAGYCECEDATKGSIFESTKVNVMKATTDPKTHPYKTCKEACDALWDGKLITIHGDGSQDDDMNTHSNEIPTQPEDPAVTPAPAEPESEDPYCFWEKPTCERCELIDDEVGNDSATAAWRRKAQCLVDYIACETQPPVKKCI